MAQSLRHTEIFPITVREVEVLRVTDVTPGMRRITLGGPGMKAHTAPNGLPVNAFRSDGFDDEFKLFFTHPSRETPLFPEQGEGRVIWPRDEHLVFRTYTARRWDPAVGEHGELHVDFVVHGLGAATTWARRAQPGDVIPIAGPKSSSTHPQGADWTLVAGDETALPAIGRWLEEWPAGARGQVFIEVAEDSHRQPELPVPDGVELTWLSRDGAEPGTTTLLQDAIVAADWWEGTPFAWVAGEALTLAPIRRWLKRERGLDREQVEVTGYWRRQAVAASSEDPELPEDSDAESAAERLHELAEIVPGFAIRTAVTLGLAEAFDGAAKSPAELASALGVPEDGLARLLRYLAALEVLEAEGTPDRHEGMPADTTTRYRLGAVGQILEEEHVQQELDLDGYHAYAEVAACLSLLDAVRGTGEGHVRHYGATHREYVEQTPALQASRIADAEEFAGYIAATLAGALPLAQLPTVAVAGPAAGELAHTLAGADQAVRVTVLGTPGELEQYAVNHPAHERVGTAVASLFEPLAERYSAVLLAGVLRNSGDADARHILAGAAGSVRQEPETGTVYVFERPLDPADIDEHDLEHDLIDYALTGGGARTDDELRGLFAEVSGLHLAGTRMVGWGGSLYLLRPGPGASDENPPIGVSLSDPAGDGTAPEALDRDVS